MDAADPPRLLGPVKLGEPTVAHGGYTARSLALPVIAEWRLDYAAGLGGWCARRRFAVRSMPNVHLAPQFQLLTHIKAVRRIHPQELHCRPANGGEADNSQLFESKMFSPKIGAGIEQRYNRAGRRVDAPQIGAFVPIAVGTGQRQIIERVSPAVLRWANVLDMKADRKPNRLR